MPDIYELHAQTKTSSVCLNNEPVSFCKPYVNQTFTNCGGIMRSARVRIAILTEIIRNLKFDGTILNIVSVEGFYVFWKMAS